MQKIKKNKDFNIIKSLAINLVVQQPTINHLVQKNVE